VRARFNPYRPFTADFTVVNAKPPRTGSYRWNFGDGTSQVTSVPYASHFYGARLDGTRPYQTFTVTVAGPPGGTGRYTVTLQDNYYHLKRQGIVQPRVSADRTLRLSGGKLVGSYTIRNLEAEPLVFDRAVAEFQYCDTSRRSSYASLAPNAPELPSVPSTPAVPATPTVPSGPTVPAAPGRSVTPGVASGVTAAPPVLATSPTPALTATTGTTIPTVAGTGVRVNAKALQHRTVTLDPAGIPNGVCGVGHHLAGRTSSGTRAYASVYFEIRPQPPLAQHRHDPQLKQLLLDLRARGLLRDETQVSYDELYRLEQEGKIRQTETGWERTDVNQ
jgi:hypothetical protein